MAFTTDYSRGSSKSFDYVIIGGGTAGLTLATCLTEDTAIQVAILEAGEKILDDPRINILGLMNTLYGDDKYDWNFKTTPQPILMVVLSLGQGGKVLGGSSAINFMMVSHASRVDIDNWEKLGNPETFKPPSESTAEALGTAIIDPSLHGTLGPVQTSFTESPGDLDKAWGCTFKTLRLGPKADPRDGHTLDGYSLPKFMDKSAKRSHAAFVKKVDFGISGEVTTATGMRYEVEGEEHFIRANREVISAAGTIQIPQLLELSGIGDKERLGKLDIAVVVGNPNVEEDLQDHPLVGIGYEVLDGIPTAEMIKQPGLLDWIIGEWNSKGLGPLTIGLTGTAFLSHQSLTHSEQTSNLSSHLKELLATASPPETLLNNQAADIQINFGATGLNPFAGNDISQIFTHDDAGGYVGIVPALTHAFSRGSIHIQSSDPKIHPIIDPKYLSHPIDLELMTAGLLFTQTLSETTTISSLLNEFANGTGKIIQPSFNVEGRSTKERAEKKVKESMVTSFHPVGTCSMLPREEGGVVDARLRVYGVRGLRVVDASVVPLNVRSNIGSAVFFRWRRGRRI